MTRDLDVVIWGATGFTGELAVAYLLGDASKITSFACERPAAPAGLRWAVCGRNPEKLAALDAGVETIVCEADDRAGIEAFVKRARVVIGFAGPFVKYSDLVVEACAKYGTHWCDITGEIVWSRSLMDRFGDRARANGACIVGLCGYDSIPSDLGTLFAVNALRSTADHPHSPIRSVVNYQLGLEGLSGGSLQTGLAGLTHPIELSDGVDPEHPFLLGGEPAGGVRDEDLPINAASYDEVLDTWVAPFAMQSINGRVVRRSNALLGYGSQFNYREVQACRTESEAQEVTRFVTNRAPPEVLLRMIDEGKLPKPGEGPLPEARARCRFQTTIVARNEANESVAVMLSGGEAAYEETAKMAIEAGLALVYDGASCPGMVSGGGFLTPAACMGTALIHRLQRADIGFDVLTDADNKSADAYASGAISRFYAAAAT